MHRSLVICLGLAVGSCAILLVRSRATLTSAPHILAQEKLDHAKVQDDPHQLVALLKSSDIERRRKAAESLQQVGRGAVPALITALDDQDGCQRRRAACVLGAIGAAAKDAIPKLVQLLADSHVQSHAMQALAKIGRDATPALAVALGHPDASVREAAAQTLGMLGTEAKEAIPRLSLALQDDESMVRIQAAYAIWRVQQQSNEPVPVLSVLTLGLKDHDRGTRKESAKLLGYICSWRAKGSHEAIPVLIASLNDEDPVVRSTVVAALSYSDSAEQSLLEALTSSDALVRGGAAEALGLSYSKTALTTLKDRLQDDDTGVRAAAQRAITRINEGRPFICGTGAMGLGADWTYHCME